MARTIVHLSDLHFGRIDAAVLPALVRAVKLALPDLVVISGDFTQRASIDEFEAAAQFLKALPQPQLAIPGNHDVPLYNVLHRWLQPLDRYRRYICDDLAPFFEDGEMAVLGINTARSLTVKDGRINRAQIEAAASRFAPCAPEVTRLVVTHHTFDAPDPVPGVGVTHNVVHGAKKAMAGFVRAKVDIILSGHLHIPSVGATTELYPLPGRAALLVHAGTATSSRRRGQVNAFNILRLTGEEVAIDCLVWQGEAVGFAVSGTERFRRTEAGWSRANP